MDAIEKSIEFEQINSTVLLGYNKIVRLKRYNNLAPSIYTLSNLIVYPRYEDCKEIILQCICSAVEFGNIPSDHISN